MSQTGGGDGTSPLSARRRGGSKAGSLINAFSGSRFPRWLSLFNIESLIKREGRCGSGSLWITGIRVFRGFFLSLTHTYPDRRKTVEKRRDNHSKLLTYIKEFGA
jgi:hypothetical protein